MRVLTNEVLPTPLDLKDAKAQRPSPLYSPPLMSMGVEVQT